MAPKPKGYIAAKSIPNELLLQVVVDCAAGRGPRPESALSTWPPKVIGAKLAKLVKRGWIGGVGGGWARTGPRVSHADRDV